MAHAERATQLHRSDDGASTWDIVLTVPASAGFVPGDKVSVHWRNPAILVDNVLALRSDWPRVMRVRGGGAPSVAGSPHEVLRDVVDLVDGHGTLPRAQFVGPSVSRLPRIAPRTYALAAVEPPSRGRQRLRLLVSLRTPAGRASGFLTGLAPGEPFAVERVPHPDRLPVFHDVPGPGLVVVTGCAIAGVLAALRAGAVMAPLTIVWGVRTPSCAYHLEEIEGWQRSGVIDRFDLVTSRCGPRQHVTDVVREDAQIRQLLSTGAWVFVSGQPELGPAVRAVLPLSLAEQHTRRERLRFVESV